MFHMDTFHMCYKANLLPIQIFKATSLMFISQTLANSGANLSIFFYFLKNIYFLIFFFKFLIFFLFFFLIFNFIFDFEFF